MARIRTVKPELFKHESLFEAELTYQLPLRLAFIALFTCCDRDGRFRWQPRRLKLDIFPYDEIDVSRVLDALAERGFVKKYECKGEAFGCIPSWSRHQHINHREMNSDIPAIEELMAFEVEKPSINKEIQIVSQPDINEYSTREVCVPDVSRVYPGGIWNREENMERNVEGKGTIVAPSMRLPYDTQFIQSIFEHWKTVMNHPNARLDHKRKTMISKSLKFGYSVEQLCDAITGCSYTPYNMGDNERGQRYDGLHVILRDGDQIDRFIHNYQHPPRSISEADRRNQANVQALQGWINRKMEEAAVHAAQ